MLSSRRRIIQALDSITQCGCGRETSLHIGGPAALRRPDARLLAQPRLMILLEGVHRVGIARGGKMGELVLRPGVRLLLEPNAWFVPDFSTDYRLFGVVFFPDRLRFLINEHDARLGYRAPRIWHHVLISPRAPVERTLDALLAVTGKKIDNGAVDFLFQGLLLLARSCLDQPTPTPTRAIGHGKATFAAILDYLEANHGDPLDRNVVAQAFRLHPGHVSRLFRQHSDTGFNETLNRLRLQKAAELLRDSQWNVADIAAACGYGSSVNFIRRFRRQFGATPAVFRELAARCPH